MTGRMRGGSTKDDRGRFQLPSKYLSDLEAEWRGNVSADGARLFAEILPRQKGLFPKPFMAEMRRLAVLTDDPIFVEILVAMHKYGFLDAEREKFLNPVSPDALKLEALTIHSMKALLPSLGSVRRASAVVAAKLGVPAASLEAAAKSVALLYEKTVKTSQT